MQLLFEVTGSPTRAFGDDEIIYLFKHHRLPRASGRRSGVSREWYAVLFEVTGSPTKAFGDDEIIYLFKHHRLPRASGRRSGVSREWYAAMFEVTGSPTKAFGVTVLHDTRYTGKLSSHS